MSTNPQAPGVVVEFMPSGNQPIEGVATAVLAIFGFTEKAEDVSEDGYTKNSIRKKAKLITSWDQYKKHFGGHVNGAYTPDAVKGFFDNGGKTAYVISLVHEKFINFNKGTAESSKNLHPAQVLVKSKPDENGNSLPSLVVKAKLGGTDGNNLIVKAIRAEEPPDAVAHRDDGFMLQVIKPGDPKPLEEHFCTMGKFKDFYVETMANGKTNKFSLIEVSVADPNANPSKCVPQFNEEFKLQGGETIETPTMFEKQKQAITEKINQLKPKEQLLIHALTSLNENANLEEQINKLLAELPEEVLPLVEKVKHTKIDAGHAKLEKEKAEKQLQQANAAKESKDKTNKVDTATTALKNADTDCLNKERELQQAEAALKSKVEGLNDRQKLCILSIQDLLDTGTPLTAQLEKTKRDRQALSVSKAQLIAPPAITTDVEGSVENREGLGALVSLDNVTLLCAPDIVGGVVNKFFDESVIKTVQGMMIKHCEQMKYRFAILDSPESCKTAQSIRDWRLNIGHDNSYAALYYPWVEVADPFEEGKKRLIPPSGHIAGLYARVDSERGVHKAPANEQLAGVIGLPINVNSAEQETLNPEGINCIRAFPGRGIRVWGARTLSLTDKSWKYINVRRLFNYVGASIDRDTQWTVFEPNDEKLWAKVRRNISAFLRNVWRSGALYGSSPEEAFYVRCDETLNDNYTRSVGQMICEIGLRPVFPAEFVIFRISQWAGPGGDEG